MSSIVKCPSCGKSLTFYSNFMRRCNCGVIVNIKSPEQERLECEAQERERQERAERYKKEAEARKREQERRERSKIEEDVRSKEGSLLWEQAQMELGLTHVIGGDEDFWCKYFREDGWEAARAWREYQQVQQRFEDLIKKRVEERLERQKTMRPRQLRIEKLMREKRYTYEQAEIAVRGQMIAEHLRGGEYTLEEAIEMVEWQEREDRQREFEEHDYYGQDDHS